MRQRKYMINVIMFKWMLALQILRSSLVLQTLGDTNKHRIDFPESRHSAKNTRWPQVEKLLGLSRE
jgi:hypothetical protein